MIQVSTSLVLFGATTTKKERGPPSKARWPGRLWTREKQKQDGGGVGRKWRQLFGGREDKILQTSPKHLGKDYNPAPTQGNGGVRLVTKARVLRMLENERSHRGFLGGSQEETRRGGTLWKLTQRPNTGKVF